MMEIHSSLSSGGRSVVAAHGLVKTARLVSLFVGRNKPIDRSMGRETTKEGKDEREGTDDAGCH
jgi:hypothetical protein